MSKKENPKPCSPSGQPKNNPGGGSGEAKGQVPRMRNPPPPPKEKD